MPIPDIDGEITVEELKKKYEELGWKKVLEFNWIVIGPNGIPLVKRFRFNADNLPCSKQGDVQYQMTFVDLKPSGVVWTCAICGQTDGPLSEEDGREMSSKPITSDEAWKVLAQTGQQPPLGLKKAERGDRFKIINS